jgi:hypothetical protein
MVNIVKHSSRVVIYYQTTVDGEGGINYLAEDELIE